MNTLTRNSGHFSTRIQRTYGRNSLTHYIYFKFFSLPHNVGFKFKFQSQTAYFTLKFQCNPVIFHGHSPNFIRSVQQPPMPTPTLLALPLPDAARPNRRHFFRLHRGSRLLSTLSFTSRPSPRRKVQGSFIAGGRAGENLAGALTNGRAFACRPALSRAAIYARAESAPGKKGSGGEDQMGREVVE